jgi:uncharacterized protein (TIGR02266 family)
MNDKDRRQHPRLSIAVEIDFRSEHNFYSAHTRDISVGGLFVETDVALPIGTRLRVDLKFLNRHVRADSEVVWVLEGGDHGVVGVGVRFLALAEAARKSIEAFMVLRKPMEFGLVEADETD